MRRTMASTRLRGSSRRGAEVGADRRDLAVGQRVPVDDRPDQVLFRAEVVLGRRRVALTRPLVDLADRHVDPAPRE